MSTSKLLCQILIIFFTILERTTFSIYKLGILIAFQDEKNEVFKAEPLRKLIFPECSPILKINLYHIYVFSLKLCLKVIIGQKDAFQKEEPYACLSNKISREQFLIINM